MITVRIGEEERPFPEATEQWINHQIQRRRADSQAVCVRVSILQGGLDLTLATPACHGASGGRRFLHANEMEVIRLWNERGLNVPDFSGGNLVAFLVQINRFFP